MLVGLVVVLPGFFAAPAGSCSCEADVVPRLARADGAIVGTVAQKQAEGSGWRYTVTVEQVHKGSAGPEVELVTRDLAGCDPAVDLAVGARQGFLLYGKGPISS
jgi:hypothetical protein